MSEAPPVTPPFERDDFIRGAARLGSGELGGKAQGLVFFNQMLDAEYERERFPEIEVVVPAFAVLTTDVFDEFLDRNNLRSVDWAGLPDDAIAERFLAAEPPPRLAAYVRALLDAVRAPLAVRSSSLLEDTIFCPLAGVYETKMVPNNQADDGRRLEKVLEAVRFVYASTFFAQARDYLRALGRSFLDEKMAVIIQEVVGTERGDRFYPHLSGVARSYNFYPSAGMRAEDGVVNLALGLGKTIVEGGVCWTYSPARPRAHPPYGSIADLLKHSQLEFWAIDLGARAEGSRLEETEYLVRADLRQAEADGTLRLLASTCEPGSDRLMPGTGRAGAHVVTFAPLLALRELPLADVVRELVNIGERAAGAGVEIEFALAVPDGTEAPARLGFLQVRPMVVGHETVDIEPEAFSSPDLMLASSHVMGNGTVNGVRDLVYVKPTAWHSMQTRLIAAELADLNQRLSERQRPYLLVGFGRWGTADPCLGIPVNWSQISGARVIVESSLPELALDPSQGSHFFHNVASTGVSYLAVQHHETPGIDWDAMDSRSAKEEGQFTRHVELDEPLRILVDGRNGKAGVWWTGS